MGLEVKADWLSKLSLYTRQVTSERYWLPLIILVSICLRVAVAVSLGDQVTNLPGTYDQISYDTLAQRVVAGYGFSFAEYWWPATQAGEPTAHWSYLYTFYLAAVYGLVGYHPLLARLIQAILAGVFMPWLVYRLGYCYFSKEVGLIAAAIMALYVYFIYYAGALVTETFYVMAVLWVFDLVGQLGQIPSKFSEIGSQAQSLHPQIYGLLLGLALASAVLLRQLFLLFIPILFAWLIWRSYRYRVRTIRQMVGIIVGATIILVVTIAPWTWRNYQAFHRFVLLNTNAGFAFFWGNHPIHGYNFISILPDNGPSYHDLIPLELLDLNEAELDQALLKEGLAFTQADPLRYLILSFSRIKDYFKFWPSSDSGLISNISRVLSFGLLWPFMIYGLVRCLQRSLSSQISILYLFLVVYTGIHLLSWALIRYRLPVDAVLIIFASVALVELKSKLTQHKLST